MTKVHLDTDIGGDMDDVCALAMLLKWPGVEITGITTTAEENGRRAGYARYMLDMMGRAATPVAAGADLQDGHYRYAVLGYPPDEENWPEPITYLPGSVDQAIELLKHSVEQGAILIGIGPLTNFMLLDKKYPGILKQADLYLMGGFVDPIPPGFPSWEKIYDWNMELDVKAAAYVLEHGNPTLIPLNMSCQTALRRADLKRLAGAGKLGSLLVRQAERFAKAEQFEQQYGETCANLPKDIINFHHDPLACAIALGWRDGVVIENAPLKVEIRDGWIYETRDPDGKPTRLVTQIVPEKFNAYWCDVICT